MVTQRKGRCFIQRPFFYGEKEKIIIFAHSYKIIMIERKPIYKSVVFWIWALFIALIIFVIILFWMISTGKLGYLPPLEELQNPKNDYATEIISNDGKTLGQYYITQNRVEVKFNDISPYMINALLATEDARFYDHSGVDFKSLFRAVVLLGKSGGGSTITQQLAKQLWSARPRNKFQRILQKPIEWVIAVNLERLYSKDEIIQMYLNQFDFLYNAVGIKSAAQVYFSTTPDQLTIEQAALLVGMCKNPSLYNPIRYKTRALNRRNTVLEQMEKYDYLSSEDCDSLKNLPLEINYTPVDFKQGIAPYFREFLRKTLTAKKPKKSDYFEWNRFQYVIDKSEWDHNPLYGFCAKNRKPDGANYDIYLDGLRIYTTIDSRMQQYAEEAVAEHIRVIQEQFFIEKKDSSFAPFARELTEEELEAIMNRAVRQTDRYYYCHKAGFSEDTIAQIFSTPVPMKVFSYDGMIDTIMTPYDSIRWVKHFLRCGFMSMDARTGHVKAYVGGPNFEHFQYDMVTLGRRQIGSTVKPYLYTLAMDEGMWPCDKMVYDSITLVDAVGNLWTPKESHAPNNVGQTVTLNWGLETSSNWVSAYVMSLFTPEQLVKLMRSFGLQGPLVPSVSLCLGPCDVSVKEMVDAYTTFPNKGIRIDPLYVTRIEDRNGNIIGTFTPQTHEIINETTAYKMIYMLRNVMNRGTGVRTRLRYDLRMAAGGKTGTSQNQSDGWFIGFTPSLVSGAWVGGEERSVHFDNITQGQGANVALPIWALYMQKVLSDPTLPYSADEQFDIPAWFDPEAGCK